MDENPDHLDNGLINFEKVCEALLLWFSVSSPADPFLRH
jgi:hypothetical protein